MIGCIEGCGQAADNLPCLSRTARMIVEALINQTFSLRASVLRHRPYDRN
jgi:hypothetical protein